MANILTISCLNPTGPWSIDREDCIGDSLNYINLNTNYLACGIQTLDTRVTNINNALQNSINNITNSFAANKLENGYQKFSSGLILQWGKSDAYSQIQSPIIVNFPIEFPNVCLNVTSTIFNSNQNFGATGDIFSQVYQFNKATLKLITQSPSPAGDNTPYSHFWQAIGY